MKRFYSKKAKILSAIACIFFALCFLMSSAASFLYVKEFDSGNEFREYVYSNAAQAYAALALSKYDSDFNADLLNEMNCYYGIIDGKVTEETDLNNDEIYVYRNFSGVSVQKEDQYYIQSYRINKDTVFKPVNSCNFIDMILSSYYACIEEHNYIHTVNLDIEGIGYDIVDGRAYVYANNQFYYLNSEYEFCDSNPYGSADEIQIVDNAYKQAWNTGMFSNTQFKPISEIAPEANLYLMPEGNIGVGVLSGDYIADLSQLHNTLKDSKDNDPFYEIPVAYLSDFSTINAAEPNTENKNYTFICFPNEAKLSAKDHVHDYYAEAQKVIGIANTVKPFLPVICIISFILACVCLVIFLTASGHVKQSEEIVAGRIDNLPIEAVFFGVMALAIFVLAIIASIFLGVHSDDSFTGSLITDGSFFIIFAVTGIAYFIFVMAMGLMFCSALAVNIKLHRLHKKSLFIKILMPFEWKKRIWIIYAATPLIIYAIISFLLEDFLGSAMTLAAYGFIDKVILAAFIFWGIRSYSKIKDSVEKIAAGDTTTRVDVTGMPQFMEETGTALNDIQAGIEIALAERTKSERMKTELITNVSHDIKTPITSIINYVDLLNKENLENENAKEYLEVLNRQSLRLKKLVEDIIEASKISSGNIELNMEKVNAEVLLDQSIGEFAERLKEKKIEVVVNSCDSEMYLMADNRYLWRVFDNIMSNIVKYAQADTRAYVDLEKDGDMLRFTFRNISREQLNISPEELMERFVRGDKSRYTDGNGLGLSIANSLTQAMGGTMNIFIDGDFFKVILEFDAITESED